MTSYTARLMIRILQLNCVKEWSLDETAEAFQKAGYNVLLYDPRGIGGSEGVPRNQPDPWQYAEDISGLSTAMMGFF
jgi:pimeloyl-ACP methyl ester carboxylesterase